MANADAWNSGWQTGTLLAAHKRERKEMQADDERHQKVSDLHDQLYAIRDRAGLDPDERQRALTQVYANLDQIYHPIHAPGALQKDWHWLKGLITRKKADADVPAPTNTFESPGAVFQPPDQSITMAATSPAPYPEKKIANNSEGVIPGTAEQKITLPSPAVTIPPSKFNVGPAASESMATPKVKGLVARGNLPIWDRPIVENDDGSHSSEFSYSFVDKRPESKYRGKEVLVPVIANGKFLTPDGKKPPEGSAEEKAMFDNAKTLYETSGQHLGVFDNPKDANKYAVKLHSRAERPRPSAEAYEPKLSKYDQQTQAQQHRAALEAELFGLSAPPSPEEEEELTSRKNLAHIQQAMTDYETANPKATGQQKTQFFNDLINKQYGIVQKPVWKEYVGPDGKSKAWLDATRPDAIPPGWNATDKGSADVRAREDYAEEVTKGYQGSFEQWKAEQSQRGKLAVPTNRDDRYIKIEQERRLGKPLSADDQAYAAAYDIYINKRVIDPIRARAAAMGADRYVQVMDFNNPEKVVFMRAGDAARSGAGSPASISFQIDKAVTRAFTVGPAATNLNYFNTATDHLRLLTEAADSLDNSDYPRWNQIVQSYSLATGDPAPTNFETVKSAVAGELSKVFKGTGATNEEIALINETINRQQSPAQLHGAINYYTGLMGGKVGSLREQYTKAKQGLPAFPTLPGEKPEAKPGAGAAGGTKTKGSVSITQAMQKPKYKGMTRDQVRLVIMQQGYVPTE